MRTAVLAAILFLATSSLQAQEPLQAFSCNIADNYRWATSRLTSRAGELLEYETGLAFQRKNGEIVFELEFSKLIAIQMEFNIRTILVIATETEAWFCEGEKEDILPAFAALRHKVP